MKKICRVGIDLDGTVANYMLGVIPLIKKHYGLDPVYNPKAYHMDEIFELTAEMNPKSMRKRLYEEFHLFQHLPKSEKDIELLTNNLHDLGFKVYIVTARAGTPIIKEDTRIWLDKYNFYYDDIFHVEEKANLCKLMRIHVMIEDEVAQILSLQKEKVNVVIPDQLWNQHITEDPHHIERKKGRLIRVTNWREALTAVKEFLL